MRCFTNWALALTILAVTTSAQAADYGDLAGQFVLDGAIPKLAPRVMKGDQKVRDPQCCSAQSVSNDTLVVNKDNKGIQHIFVYLKSVSKSKIHPDLKASKKKEVVFDQKGCQFTPHTMLVRTDQQVVVKSGDNIPHNTHSIPIFNKGENFIVAANDREGVKMPKFVIKERLPIEVKCDIHGWMSARWLILDHPYAAITDKDGKFTIPKLPAGDYEFIVWHERVGYINKTLKVAIKKDATTDLKAVKVAAAKFEIKDDELAK
jgi:hypothetical protein